jgi:DNA-binding transcriptional ArsR family regulator
MKDDEIKILKEIKDELKEINVRLEKMQSITKILQSSNLQKALSSVRSSKLRSDIFELCDGKHSVNDIAGLLKKPQPLISKYLSNLEKAGLVISETRERNKYFFKSI